MPNTTKSGQGIEFSFLLLPPPPLLSPCLLLSLPPSPTTLSVLTAIGTMNITALKLRT